MTAVPVGDSVGTNLSLNTTGVFSQAQSHTSAFSVRSVLLRHVLSLNHQYLDVSWRLWDDHSPVFLGLAYFTQHCELQFHPFVASFRISLFLWMNNNPLCVYTTFSLFIYELVGIWGWFHMSAILNTAAVNSEVQISFHMLTLFPLDIFQELE